MFAPVCELDAPLWTLPPPPPLLWLPPPPPPPPPLLLEWPVFEPKPPCTLVAPYAPPAIDIANMHDNTAIPFLFILLFLSLLMSYSFV